MARIGGEGRAKSCLEPSRPLTLPEAAVAAAFTNVPGKPTGKDVQEKPTQPRFHTGGRSRLMPRERGKDGMTRTRREISDGRQGRAARLKY
jgi:hypothetical protein